MSDSVYRGALVFENHRGEVKTIYGKVHNKPGPAKASATRLLSTFPDVAGVIWFRHPKIQQVWNGRIGDHQKVNHPDDNYFFVSRHVEEATEWTKV